MSKALKYYTIYKPFDVVSQFTDPGNKHRTLKDLYKFPKDVYPVGRLDKDSEGLLLLTNDKKLNHKLLSPKKGHEREYWVQVEGIPHQTDLEKLEQGVDIKVNKKVYHTKHCKADFLSKNIIERIPDRHPPIRYRKNVPETWLTITLIEGKNRQVRKMTAAIGFPTLRLIRTRIGLLELDRLNPGEVRELPAEDTREMLLADAFI